MTNPNAIEIELADLQSEIESAQLTHQLGADDCARELRPAYGGPGTCARCDSFDTMLLHMTAIREAFAVGQDTSPLGGDETNTTQSFSLDHESFNIDESRGQYGVHLGYDGAQV